jgi:ATP-dependent protease ClpP protease subunit
MPELLIRVPSYIGPSYFEESADGWYGEWVQGITKADVEMQVEWAKILGEEPDGILLEIGICDGGSTVEGFNIYNYLRGLGLPIRCRILALAASMAVPLALAADELPEMDYTAQLMLHSASFNRLIYAPTSTDLRSQADRLDNTNQLLTDLLIARTGQTAEVVAGWMSKDTWLTASQAKAVGLCGKVNPLTVTVTPVEADTLITARRRRATEVLARRARLAPQATTAAPAAPLIMPDVKKPIGQAAKPTPRAAAQPASSWSAGQWLSTTGCFSTFSNSIHAHLFSAYATYHPRAAPEGPAHRLHGGAGRRRFLRCAPAHSLVCSVCWPAHGRLLRPGHAQRAGTGGPAILRRCEPGLRAVALPVPGPVSLRARLHGR